VHAQALLRNARARRPFWGVWVTALAGRVRARCQGCCDMDATLVCEGGYPSPLWRERAIYLGGRFSLPGAALSTVRASPHTPPKHYFGRLWAIVFHRGYTKIPAKAVIGAKQSSVGAQNPVRGSEGRTARGSTTLVICACGCRAGRQASRDNTGLIGSVRNKWTCQQAIIISVCFCSV
jgi:hypothetical protein